MAPALFCDNDLNPRPADDALLAGVQGNILRAYRKLRSRHVFFRFSGPSSDVKAWLRANVAAGAPFSPTTALLQESARPSVLRNFMLTAEGLRYLGVDVARMDAGFQRGSRHEKTLSILNDPTPDVWATNLRRASHVMMLLTGDTDSELEDQVTALKRSLAPIVSEQDLHEEFGHALDANGDVAQSPADKRHEHFGYRDGISDAVFLQSHWDQVKTRYKLTDDRPSRGSDPRRQLSVALAHDPLVSDAEAYFGTYWVHRKLQQDVLGFQERVASYVAALMRKGAFLNSVWQQKGDGRGYELFNGTPPAEDVRQFVLQRLMGRAQDGRPWPLWNEHPPEDDAGLNDFDYVGDQGARVCPFSAHARKMNPRGLTGNLEDERKRTLMRRGIPYGMVDRAGGTYKQDTGLLFLCAQASISEQFEFVQRNWANAAVIDANRTPTPTRDSVAGQKPQSQERARYEEDRHHKISETIEVDLDFYDLVTFRGGEYLFAPSIEGLQRLATASIQVRP